MEILKNIISITIVTGVFIFSLFYPGTIFSLLIYTIKKYTIDILKSEITNNVKLRKWIDQLPEYSFLEYIRKYYFIDLWKNFLNLQTVIIPLHFIISLFSNKNLLTQELITAPGLELFLYIPTLFYTYIKLLKLHEEKGFVKSHIIFTITSLSYYIYIYKEYYISFFGEATLYFIIAIAIFYILSWIFFLPLEKNYVPYDWQSEKEKLKEDLKREEEKNIEYNYSNGNFSIFDVEFAILTKYSREEALASIANSIDSYTNKLSNQDNETENNALKLKQYKILYELFFDEELFNSIKKIIYTKEKYKEKYLYEKINRDYY